jgi:hypothetical protein
VNARVIRDCSVPGVMRSLARGSAGRPELAKASCAVLRAVEAPLETVTRDQDANRQTDWTESDLAIILTALLAGLRADELRQATSATSEPPTTTPPSSMSKAKAAKSAAYPSKPNYSR